MVALLFALGVSVSSMAASGVDRLYENASDGSPAISLIRSAKKTIDVEIYTMKDLGVINELKAAVMRNVKLRIIQTPNPVGDPCPVFKANDSSTPADCLTLREFVTYVNSQGGSYVPFSLALCGNSDKSCFQHGKMIVVDSNQALISTGNFDPSNLCDVSENPARCNRDFTMLTTDKNVVSALSTVFENDLHGHTYNLEAVLASEPRITVSPDSMTPLVSFINSAQKSIQIENQYLNDPTLNDALIAASKRGVKVFVMVGSVSAFGRLLPDQDQAKITLWTSNFTAFDAAGVKSRIFDDEMKVNGQPGYLHAKAILVDGVHAWVGSVNGSTESLTLNREFGIFSDDLTVVKHLGEVLYADFANRDAESWQQSLACKKDACGKGHAPAVVVTNEESPKDDPSPGLSD